MSEITIRPAAPQDREECGRILFEAFRDIADRHGFPWDFPSEAVAQGMMGFIIDHSFGVVAERGGRVVGSNFLKEGDPIAALGPISVDPSVQGDRVGRRLMEAVIEQGRRSHGVRLVQDAFNATSMALYADLGFEVREPLVLLNGTPRSAASSDLEVRPLVDGDLADCAALCQKVHGIDRTNELRAAIGRLGPHVALRAGRVTAYASTTHLWFAAHGVAETERDMEALLAGAALATGNPLAFLLPTRQAALFRWALAEGLRVVKPMTLMSLGPYQEPQGFFFPSVGY